MVIPYLSSTVPLWPYAITVRCAALLLWFVWFLVLFTSEVISNSPKFTRGWANIYVILFLLQHPLLTLTVTHDDDSHCQPNSGQIGHRFSIFVYYYKISLGLTRACWVECKGSENGIFCEVFQYILLSASEMPPKKTFFFAYLGRTLSPYIEDGQIGEVQKFQLTQFWPYSKFIWRISSYYQKEHFY